MPLKRRALIRAGLGAAAGVGVASSNMAASGLVVPRLQGTDDDWRWAREQFALAGEYLHFGGLYIASHPASVRDAIERHRQALDANPVHYLIENNGRLEAAVRRAAADYLGAQPEEVALTDSTTMGLGLLYNGLAVRADQELLTTQHDFYATHEALRLKAERTGATLRQVPLYARLATVSEDEIVAALAWAITPATRVVAVTWVHSSTGLKLPIRRFAELVAEVNAQRHPDDRALLCVDGVHGLGVEDAQVADLGCDFLVAGTHKWLCGPRGTGLVWGRPGAWQAVTPTIPSFSSSNAPGAVHTPGGFHSFEHRWALAEAFGFHQALGKTRVAQRIHALNRQLKEGLAAMPHVTLVTPMAEELSAGLVCFEVQGYSPSGVVQRLRQAGIIITTTPYSPSYARAAPGLLNSPDEVDALLTAVRAMA